jgi:tetratricopeptide (TPR) repeat protein
MGRLAEKAASVPPHVQRPFFALHSTNFHTALTAADHVGMDLHGAALAQALAVYAKNRQDFAQAEYWYRKSLTNSEKQGNEHYSASIYHQLGIIAQKQHDFAQAEQWYRKSLAIDEDQGDEQGVASTYHQLGLIAQQQRDFAQAGQWYVRSIVIFLRYNDRYNLRVAAQSFLRCYAQALPAVQATLKALWEDAGLGPLPAENAQE